MALDFPNSPTAGQLYAGSNGVVYQWSSTYTAWLPLSVTGAGQGDFFASGSGSGWTSTPATPTTLVVQSGNALGSFVPATGRYTPPAGRYKIFAGLDGAVSAATVQISLQLRKNGTVFLGANMACGINSGHACPVAEAIVDANGTDWFDWQGSTNGATINIAGNYWFGAFPITGAAQPAGTGSAWRQIGRVVLGTAAASIDFQNVPADINDLKCFFDCVPVTNDVDFVLQFYDASNVLDTASGRYAWSTLGTNSNAPLNAAPFASSSVSSTITTAIILNQSNTNNKVANTATSALNGIQGDIRFYDIRETTRAKRAIFNSAYINAGLTGLFGIAGSGYRGVAGAITGLRLSFGSGNIAAGSTATLWGSP